MSTAEVVRVATVILKEKKVLLVQEGTPIIRGLWNWSQGAVEEGEHLEEAAIREAYEETGYTVKILQKLNVLHDPFPGTKEIHIFLAEVTGGDLHVDGVEILDARWFSYAELKSFDGTMKEYARDVVLTVLKMPR